MGQKLVKLFDFAKANGGLTLMMRMAMKTGVSSPNAATAPDDPAVLEKAKQVIKEATGKVPMV